MYLHVTELYTVCDTLFFSGVECIWLNEYEKGNTFPFYSHELSAETLCVNVMVNSAGPVLLYRK